MKKINFYGRRRGRPLTPDRQNLFDQVMPQVEIQLDDSTHFIDMSTLFDDANKELRMEIGFGGGEHLAHQAKLHPHINFIGCEVFLNGVASLVRYVAEQSIENISIYDDDVHTLFPKLPDHCLSRLYILFPDPWPKKKHFKRRIIREENLHIFHRLLKPGGKLMLATDDLSYAEWMFDHLTNCPLFYLPQDCLENCTTPLDNWIETRYQTKAVSQGRSTFYFVAESL